MACAHAKGHIEGPEDHYVACAYAKGYIEGSEDYYVGPHMPRHKCRDQGVHYVVHTHAKAYL